MAEGEEDFVKSDLHYDGIFCPKPLVYFNDKMVPLRDLDFKGMNFSAFFTVIRKIVVSRSIVLYYCLPHESISDGLGVIQNEGDYREFLEVTFASPGKKVKVYVDYNNEPLFDWIELENPDEFDDLEADQDEEAEETPFADGIKAEHQEDAVETKPEPVDDPFLNKLCPQREEADGEFQQQYPFHNPNMAWDNMVPVIGMQFSNPAELKELLANYAVKHGYPLWFEKTDKKQILVNCGQNREKMSFQTLGIMAGICKGELLSAVGRDANDNIYPLAWAIVVVENKELWQWFLDLLMNDIQGGNGGGLTIMSDASAASGGNEGGTHGGNGEGSSGGNAGGTQDGHEGGTHGGHEGGTKDGNAGGTHGGNGEGSSGGNAGGTRTEGPSGGGAEGSSGENAGRTRAEGPSGGGAEGSSGGRGRRAKVPVPRRRPSERIINIKLGTRVITKDGKGGSGDKPVMPQAPDFSLHHFNFKLLLPFPKPTFTYGADQESPTGVSRGP
ncbi:hypothetical protein LXL04_007767 [Taraxacum kok-saghyz]